MEGDPGLIRAVGLFFPIIVTLTLLLVRPPDRRMSAGILLAFLWNLPMLLLLHLFAWRFGWWSFQAEGGVFLGMPVDLYFGWAILWGPLPLLVFRNIPLAAVLPVTAGVDLLLMPLCAPVVALGERWWMGEIAALLLCLLPAQLLGRWTARGEQLYLRAISQAVLFSGIMLGVLPAIVIEGTGGSWIFLLDRSFRITGVLLQLLALPAIFGVAAVQEFALRGKGTPFPFDPPSRLVTSGPYAYVANPMQISAALLFVGWGMVLGSIPVTAGALVCVAYSVGLAWWDETRDMENRFGSAWRAYRASVRSWIPRMRPSGIPAAVLYVSEECDICSPVGRWILRRNPVALKVVPAEIHPGRDLERITYEAEGIEARGITAFARALEHIDLRWAFLGWTMRLPVLNSLIGIIVDASGGGPMTVRRREGEIQACRDMGRE